MEKKISPSLMCCDFFEMGKQLSAFEKEKIEYLHVDLIDGVLVMTVNPGFAGQKLVEGSIEKIRKTRRFLGRKKLPKYRN